MPGGAGHHGPTSDAAEGLAQDRQLWDGGEGALSHVASCGPPAEAAALHLPAGAVSGRVAVPPPPAIAET